MKNAKVVLKVLMFTATVVSTVCGLMMQSTQLASEIGSREDDFEM